MDQPDDDFRELEQRLDGAGRLCQPRHPGWETLVVDEYPPPPPKAPAEITPPERPDVKGSEFAPQLVFWDYVLPRARKRKMREAFSRYERRVEELDQENSRRQRSYETTARAWEADREEFLKNREERNERENRRQYPGPLAGRVERREQPRTGGRRRAGILLPIDLLHHTGDIDHRARPR